MKKLLLILLVAMSFMSCEKDTPIPTANMEGKWVIEGDNPNTMYIFEDGIRYTYYCVYDDCNTWFRQSCEAGDSNAIPETNSYTFDNDILTIDLNFGNFLITPITFDCDGEIATLETPGYNLYSLGTECQ
tara:strand:+ start:643 stop:1032 length:390 start_codon:yes stop_codon:yes gene_type:complete